MSEGKQQCMRLDESFEGVLTLSNGSFDSADMLAMSSDIKYTAKGFGGAEQLNTPVQPQPTSQQSPNTTFQIAPEYK